MNEATDLEASDARRVAHRRALVRGQRYVVHLERAERPSSVRTLCNVSLDKPVVELSFDSEVTCKRCVKIAAQEGVC